MNKTNGRVINSNKLNILATLTLLKKKHENGERKKLNKLINHWLNFLLLFEQISFNLHKFFFFFYWVQFSELFEDIQVEIFII